MSPSMPRSSSSVVLKASFSLRSHRSRATNAKTRSSMDSVKALGALHLGQQFDELLLAFRLVLAGFGLGELRDVHRAEFRSAHGAELCFFIEVIGKIFVVHGTRRVRIE